MRFDAFDAYDKGAEMIGLAGSRRGDIIRQRHIWLTRRFLYLLTQELELDVLRTGAYRYRIFSIGICRPEADNRAGFQPFFFDDLIQQFLCVVVQLCRFGSDDGIREDLWVFAMQLPGDKERTPVDVFGNRRK